VHDHVPLPVRRRGRAPRPITSRTRSSTAPGL
jgi:hypothetical protein